MYRVLGKGGFGEVCACQVNLLCAHYIAMLSNPLHPQTLSLSLYFCVPIVAGARHRENVRVQKAGEKTYKETQGGVHGAHRETNTAKNKLTLRCQSGLCIRDKGCPLPGADHNEWCVLSC